ncbi:hypothetical protein PPERSA_00903 [Pseudocohnilembus persalinus]|uniref:HTH La-type RNA-binding domain-containing protein n=1 Tax=Pseudocohnilembus persalinus TaxID=266149 RepID=A0A0V0QEQ1_PSEPJ|nr:hypothetical protein PPERSA_00903 [Pseudocohnilembus persalinus]|eukprot:KRX00676.1 hypothetical protein PPERSA_00903 [Pseudocohnilembus persalinus]
MATEDQIITQIEYYLSDKNLERDEFFHKQISAAEGGYIPVDLFLKCNKVKKMEITAEQIINAMKNSKNTEIKAEEGLIRRKDNEKLPGLVTKKFKGNNGEEKQVKQQEQEQAQVDLKAAKPQEEVIFSVTSESKTNAMQWKFIQDYLEKIYKVTPIYCRYSKIGNEGNFILDKANVSQETIDKILEQGIKIGDDYSAKITLTQGADLEQFYQQHGAHYESCLILASQGKSAQESRKQKQIEKREKRKQQVIRFCGEKYIDLNQLKNSFKGILGRTANNDPIKAPYEEMLKELLNYHEKKDEKLRDFQNFTVDIHPQYKDTRCFFVVRKDGSKEDFSFTKCLVRLDQQKQEDLKKAQEKKEQEKQEQEKTQE